MQLQYSRHSDTIRVSIKCVCYTLCYYIDIILDGQCNLEQRINFSLLASRDMGRNAAEINSIVGLSAPLIGGNSRLSIIDCFYWSIPKDMRTILARNFFHEFLPNIFRQAHVHFPQFHCITDTSRWRQWSERLRTNGWEHRNPLTISIVARYCCRYFA